LTQLRPAVALALLTALSGCIGFLEPDYLMPAKRTEKVREVADLYGQYLRFGRIPEAASFVRREDRPAFLEAFLNSSRRLEFTNAEIVSVEPTTATTCEVWARYELFTPPSLEIRTLSERQVWHYDAVRRVWQVQPDLGVFPPPRAPRAEVSAPAS
jgi:hypothetical protein